MSISPFAYDPKALPDGFQWVGAMWYPAEYATDTGLVKCAMVNVAEDTHGGLWLFGVHGMISTWGWFFELHKVSDMPLENLPIHFMAMATPQTVEATAQNAVSTAGNRS